MNKRARIAVTGASGFLAAYLIQELKNKGFENLVLFTRDKSRVSIKGFDIVEVEMTNPVELAEALRGVEVVFHTAAVVSFSDKDADKIIEENVDITSHLVDAALKVGVKKIIHTSSIAALGGMREGKIYIDEQSLLTDFKNTSAYGQSKFLCENLILKAGELGVETVIVNPGVIVGRGDSLLVRLKKGMRFYTQGVTGYVTVEDVSRAQVALMQEPKAVGERFVLVGENISFKDLIFLGSKRPWFKVGRRAMKVLVFFSSMWAKISSKDSLLTKSGARAAQTKSYYNGEKVRKYIDFKYTSVTTAIKKALDK
ncbi:MAG: NAD-dependent epimerase/dehydratase family protein [Rikenellaceae bacterium]